MLRSICLSILLCFVAFQVDVGLTASHDGLEGNEQRPEPTQPHSSTAKPPTTVPTTVPPTHTPSTNGSTVTPIPSSSTTPTPSTNGTTVTPKPTSSTTPTPSTNGTTVTPIPTSSTTQTPSTNGTTVSPTTNGTTVSPSTTSAPPTPPSDRKFDAFSFLGGFALGLGLVAIGFLSWKFYQSRQENYYHTL